MRLKGRSLNSALACALGHRKIAIRNLFPMLIIIPLNRPIIHYTNNLTQTSKGQTES